MPSLQITWIYPQPGTRSETIGALPKFWRVERVAGVVCRCVSTPMAKPRALMRMTPHLCGTAHFLPLQLLLLLDSSELSIRLRHDPLSGASFSGVSLRV